MSNKSYWIWHWGDYEIFHTLNLHMKREERGYHRPAFWKLSTPFPSVKFKKEINTAGGYLICHINGTGHVCIDGNLRYRDGERITLTPGAHTVEVHVTNFGGLPAIFAESDTVPTDKSWVCNHFAGDYTPVGCSELLCSLFAWGYFFSGVHFTQYNAAVLGL